MSTKTNNESESYPVLKTTTQEFNGNFPQLQVKIVTHDEHFNKNKSE